MARMARLKVSDVDAWYHIHNRIAGRRGEFPLSEPAPRRKLIGLFEHFRKIYFCDVSAFCVMGNHYHLVVRFSKVKPVSKEELKKRAEIQYPSRASRRAIALWSDERWERFRQRLFDVSELMRNLQSAFARWYNKTYDRRGRFWADRFKSVLLQTGTAALDCMLYVDLNPIRAGLVERPEEWTGSSLYLRGIDRDDWLMPLNAIFGEKQKTPALIEYRARVYYRGNVPSRQGQGVIPDRIVDDEVARGFKTRGLYRKRLGYFVDGMAVGTEVFVRSQLIVMRAAGLYLRRRNPIDHLGGIHFSLREQRGTTVVF